MQPLHRFSPELNSKEGRVPPKSIIKLISNMSKGVNTLILMLFFTLACSAQVRERVLSLCLDR